MVDITKDHVTCFVVGIIIVVIVITIIAYVNKDKGTYREGNTETNQTRTDITACLANETRIVDRDPVSGNINFRCLPKEKGKKESYVGLGGGGPRVCNYNQTTEVRGLPNGAGLPACSDTPSRPLQSTTRKTVNGKEPFVNVGAVPGYNCTFKQTSSGADNIFGPQYTCMPVKVNVASSAAEGYQPKAYSFKTHSRANFMGTNYRNNFVPNLRNRVSSFMGTDYRKGAGFRENMDSMSSGAVNAQPIGNNRTAGCTGSKRMTYIRRGPSGDLDLQCTDIM